jgi:hypothetical protein
MLSILYQKNRLVFLVFTLFFANANANANFEINNLSSRNYNFTGRLTELSSLYHIIKREKIASIVGPRGIGKTQGKILD